MLLEMPTPQVDSPVSYHYPYFVAQKVYSEGRRKDILDFLKTLT